MHKQSENPVPVETSVEADPVIEIDSALVAENAALDAGHGGVFAPDPVAHSVAGDTLAGDTMVGGTMAGDKPRRMYYGDAIRIFGTIAVVVGHVADMRLFSDKTLDQEWWIANAWDAASRWAVPIYIMLSGALLLDPSRKELPSTFYRKRLGRLGVPLVFWTAFFMWFGVQYTKAVSYQTPDGVKVTGVTAAWYLLAMGKPYVHLHFIFRIAGLYLFTPMMRIWLANTPRKMQWVGVIAVLSLSGADSVMNALTRTEPSVFARFVPFIGYYLLGYMLRDTVVSKRGMIYCWIGFIVTYLILMLGTGWTVWRYHKAGSQLIGPPSMEMLQYDFLSPTRIVMTICVWLIFVRLFRHPWPKSERGRKIFGWWASTTLGIYLIHPMFRDIFDCQRKWIPFTSYDTFMFHPYKATYPNIWIGIPLTVFMVYFWSLVVIAILMKIPLIRRIAG